MIQNEKEYKNSLKNHRQLRMFIDAEKELFQIMGVYSEKEIERILEPKKAFLTNIGEEILVYEKSMLFEIYK